MKNETTRRTFIKTTGAGIAALASGGIGAAHAAKREYGISLAGWSLHRTIGTGADKTPMLDMPKLAREEFGIEAIELVNRMLAASDKAYVDNFIKNAAAHDVKIILIMVDGEGNIGGSSESARADAVKRHSKWIDIAADMGCHSIRMNWAGGARNVMDDATALSEFIERSVSGLRALCDYGDGKDINVIIENHGGPSSHPPTMERLITAVDHERFGTLPDFGNFPRDDSGEYTLDIYEGIDSMMRFAKALSAKCYDFDVDTGLETRLDFERLLSICVDKHGYHGYIGIEYEGNRLSEFDGIKACKRLLETLKG